MAAATTADAEGQPWVPLVDKLLEEYDKETLGSQAAADKMESALRETDFMYDMDIDCRQVGFDPHNRDVIEEEVSAIPADIIHIGWSEKEAAHAICCEDVPGEWTVEEHNVKVCRDSTVLAPVEPKSIRFGSLACSHNNGGLRAIKARMPCTEPRLSVDARYSRDPRYAARVNSGLRWRVIRWQVRAEVKREICQFRRRTQTCAPRQTHNNRKDLREP